MEATFNRNAAMVIGKSWIWWVVGGAIALFGGFFAFLNPVAASLTVTIITGVAFLLLGVAQTIAAVRMRGSDGFIWKLLLGLLTAVTGFLLLDKPLAGMVTLTIVVGAMFAAMGIAKILLGLRMRGMRGWGWVILSGAISLLLAFFIFSDFPSSAAIILGILLAVELISTGVSLIFAGLAIRRLATA